MLWTWQRTRESVSEKDRANPARGRQKAECTVKRTSGRQVDCEVVWRMINKYSIWVDYKTIDHHLVLQCFTHVSSFDFFFRFSPSFPDLVMQDRKDGIFTIKKTARLDEGLSSALSLCPEHNLREKLWTASSCWDSFPLFAIQFSHFMCHQRSYPKHSDGY